MVKNGCGQSGERTLKLIVSEEWTVGITDFLHIGTDSQKLNADQIFFGEHGQKWVWRVWSWGFKMLVQIQ